MIKNSLMQREEVLRYIDSLQFRTQYIKIIILDNNDSPLRAIEGRATAGSININNASAVRRTGSLTLVTEYKKHTKHPFDIMHEVTNIKTLISMNKRVQVQIGIENNGNQFPDEEIFWIPMGVLLIQSASVTYNNQGITIQLKLVDKMALLNGEMGGTFTTDITHAPIGDYETDAYGKQVIVNQSVKTYSLIEALVRDYGELGAHEYIIDVPESIKNLLFWKDSSNYLCKNLMTGEFSIQSSLKDIDSNIWIVYGFNEPIGYTYTDFVYPVESGKTLESKAGETITSVLDKIKNTLGNYEYFFDINGVFHFQEIRNFLNEGSKVDNLMEAIAEKYFMNVEASTRSVYRFDETNLVTSYQNNPQYNQIKNDFSVWGKKGATETPIQYHLVFQDAPDEYTKQYWRVQIEDNKISTVTSYNEADEATNGNHNKFNINNFVSGIESDYLISFVSAYRPTRLNASGEPQSWTKDDDWRLKMYLETFEKKQNGGLLTPFEKELQVKMPTLYALEPMDLKHSLRMHTPAIEKTEDVEGKRASQEFFAPIYDKNNLTYWLDIINTNDVKLRQTVDITTFGIESIGRRTKALNDDKVNCLFYSFEDDSLKDVIFVEVEGDKVNNLNVGKDNPFWESVGVDLVENPAYDLLRTSLHEYLSYNNNINLSAIPVYYLDVNQRITVTSPESDIHGDYVINSISIPLTIDGLMTINARKAVERI